MLSLNSVNFKDRGTQIITLLILAVVALLLYWALIKREPKISSLPQELAVTSIELTAPPNWQRQELTAADRTAGIVARLNKPLDPAASLVVRGAAGQLAPSFNIQELPDQIVANFEGQLDDFKLISKQVKRVGNYETAQIRYTQVSSNGETYDYLLIVLPTQSQSYYLTARTAENRFKSIARDVRVMANSLSKHAYEYETSE